MPEKLPLNVFLRTFKLSPRVAVRLLFVNPDGKILLVRRILPVRQSTWHLPGAFILRDEKISKCIERIAKDELGLRIKGTSGDIVGVFEDLEHDPRGHIVKLIYRFTLDREPRIARDSGRECRFVSKIPKSVGLQYGDIARHAASRRRKSSSGERPRSV